MWSRVHIIYDTDDSLFLSSSLFHEFFFLYQSIRIWNCKHQTCDVILVVQNCQKNEDKILKNEGFFLQFLCS